MALVDLESVERPDAEYIRSMFDRMASRYDKFTWWMSLGGAKAMRCDALKDLKAGDRVLDLACGTGDLALEAANRVGANGHVTGLDFSPGMLDVARRREQRTSAHGLAPIQWVCQGAETLPLNGERFDWIVSAFALRGLYEHIGQILDGMRAALNEGGRIALLDLTEPRGWIRRGLFKIYFYSYVAFVGWILFGKKYPVTYLPKAVSRFAKASEFVQELKRHGFKNVTAKSYIFGAVTLYRGER